MPQPASVIAGHLKSNLPDIRGPTLSLMYWKSAAAVSGAKALCTKPPISRKCEYGFFCPGSLSTPALPTIDQSSSLLCIGLTATSGRCWAT
jgi:hypothetical protein